jgi:hypothetical protein
VLFMGCCINAVIMRSNRVSVRSFWATCSACCSFWALSKRASLRSFCSTCSAHIVACDAAMDRRVLVTDSLWDFKSDRRDSVMEVNSDCPSSRVKFVPADVAELAECVEALSSAWGLDESVLFSWRLREDLLLLFLVIDFKAGKLCVE